MSERVRARQSPLRDLMLELHRLGIEVKFYDGRPGHPDADVFFVKMPAGFSMEETCKILSRIHKAMDESVGLRPQPLLSYQSASAYIGQMDELERDSNEHKRNQGIRSSGDREDDVHLETDHDGGGAVRSGEHSGGELHQGGRQRADQPRSGHRRRPDWNSACPLLPIARKT